MLSTIYNQDPNTRILEDAKSEEECNFKAKYENACVTSQA